MGPWVGRHERAFYFGAVNLLRPMLRYQATLTALSCISVLVCASCGIWWYDRSSEGVLRGGDESGVRLTLDSKAVRELVASEVARDSRLGMARGSPEDLALRSAFLNRFSAQPSIFERSGAKVTILERSECFCLILPHYTDSLLRIRLLTGRHAGAEMWACDPSVGQFLSVP